MDALRRLERLRTEFGGDAGSRKLACLRQLRGADLKSTAAVQRLHEVLCFMRAYPDDAGVLAAVTGLLDGFARRRDLRRFAGRLGDTGIAGTALHYSFYADTAAWLARRFPRELEIDWGQLEDDVEQRVLDRLDLILHYSEAPAVDEIDLSMRQWLERLAGPREAHGAFLARRFAALDAEPFLREAFYDELGLTLVLAPGKGTPSRTSARARLPGRRVSFQGGPMRGGRPELRSALERRPRVRALSSSAGARMIDLARDAMVTRSRDLDCFVYGDPRDVRLVECEDGLAFVAIGLQPERRLSLEAVYAFLTLKNEVPIGYVLNSALFGSAEVAYNVFETFRGGEAAHVYGWALCAVRHLFGVDSFTIYPYQLGHGNEEGLASGAWWFYQKLGFRPRDGKTLALMRAELGHMRKAKHRSSRAVLKRLAAHNIYYHLGRERRDVIGEVALGNVALAASRLLARRFGSEREEGQAVCASEAARRLGLRSQKGWSRDERRAWERWAPITAAMPGVERWSAAEKRAALAVIRAKGGRRESDFVRLFDGHRKLRAAVLSLTRR